jgi:parvulin-like peptidyl-prolyl isomerase
MLKAEVDEKITPQTIPPDAVKKYYDEHIDEFVRPELRRASQILLKDDGEAKALLEQAKTSDMRAFRELARIKSLDETNKLRGGDLGYFDAKGKPDQKPEQTGTTVDPATAKAAFALKTVGDTSPVIKTDAGFVILKLTGLRQAHTDTPKDADERIRMRLWRERREGAIDGMLAELRKELQPSTKPELIDAIKFDDEPPVAPGEGLPAGFPHTKPPPVVVSKPE